MADRDNFLRAHSRYAALENTSGPVLHIRFEGASRDIPLELLQLKAGASDGDIHAAVASYLSVSARQLADYVVERHSNGNLTVRPEAVFG